MGGMQDRFANGLIAGGMSGGLLGFVLGRTGPIGFLIAGAILGAIALILRDMFRAADDSKF